MDHGLTGGAGVDQECTVYGLWGCTFLRAPQSQNMNIAVPHAATRPRAPPRHVGVGRDTGHLSARPGAARNRAPAPRPRHRYAAYAPSVTRSLCARDTYVTFSARTAAHLAFCPRRRCPAPADDGVISTRPLGTPGSVLATHIWYRWCRRACRPPLCTHTTHCCHRHRMPGYMPKSPPCPFYPRPQAFLTGSAAITPRREGEMYGATSTSLHVPVSPRPMDSVPPIDSVHSFFCSR